MATTRDASRAGAQPGSLLVVVHDFKARSADELSLAKGDRIELIEKDEGKLDILVNNAGEF